MLGEKIKSLRKSKGLTQTELGKMVGIRQATLAMYETGKLIPPTGRILCLAQVLEASPVDLFACLTQPVTGPN